MNPPTFPSHWRLSSPILIAETFSSRIWKVFRADGTPAIVKALKPFDDVEDELRGAHLLKWRGGHGAVRLFGFDGSQMLIEYAGERHLSAEIAEFGDNAATEIAAEVMAKLHAPSRQPPPAELQPLRERFAALFDRAKADRAADKDSLYVEAAITAERLLSDPKDIRPLHGDLHHDNILLSPRGWLAIDPKGVLGDPGFDAANLFYNPLERDDLCLDENRIAFMAAVFAKTLRQDERRILDHAFAYGCLSAAWHASDDNAIDEERELAVARSIRRIARML
ncbi:aminoglycoside phosphotransferase family protein [Mesorhizobium sp. LHD-90]|uniref:aminoglycoside phosphotransferase family protein n=1 Tax=Mesorhizobium sp. LHD-90 TaxID=3071414 RepID=UPI0027E18239|nr:aminoglycoside phosphotransferase family protein [Mesorhizobium sp. LHD-90]MDQ6434584.1 aminoglycoside phosphotransferase family protein [Mesorhizobium sp. LHD-90]